MYLSVHSFLIHPYVGIIQIRFAGRSSQLPLSLVHKLPICDYKAEYKNNHWKCQAFCEILLTEVEKVQKRIIVLEV